MGMSSVGQHFDKDLYGGDDRSQFVDSIAPDGDDDEVDEIPRPRVSYSGPQQAMKDYADADVIFTHLLYSSSSFFFFFSFFFFLSFSPT